MWRRYWQHFLNDDAVLAQIAQTVFRLQDELWCTDMIEIWPGKGDMTKLIIDAFEQVTLYEIDTSMKFLLEKIINGHAKAEIMWGDVLEKDILVPHVANPPTSQSSATSLIREDHTLVVWNLPYYITSPILRKFFEYVPHEPSPLTPPNPLSPLPKGEAIRGELAFQRMYPWGVFLVQKEVADKLSSEATKKSYLRRLINYGYDVTYEFTVWADAFDPPPRVESAVISLKRILTPNPSPSERGVHSLSYSRMIQFLDAVSWLKRKTLGKIWKMRAEFLESFELPDELRGKRIEQLGWDDMGMICG